jgi:hypothetical protein
MNFQHGSAWSVGCKMDMQFGGRYCHVAFSECVDMWKCLCVACSSQHRSTALLGFFLFPIERNTCALLWYSHMIVVYWPPEGC